MLILQHVLPKGFRRSRDYGFLHGNAKKTLKLIQLILYVKISIESKDERPVFKCSNCGSKMQLIACMVFKRTETNARASPKSKVA